MFSLTPEYEQLSLIEQVQQISELPSRSPMKFLQYAQTRLR